MDYELNIAGPFATMVSIFHGDGSVQISHGGVEIGQGINTKVRKNLLKKNDVFCRQLKYVLTNWVYLWTKFQLFRVTVLLLQILC